MTQQIIDNAKRLEKPVTLYIFSVLAFSLVAVYIYFINATVMHVVSRNSVENQISSIQSSIGDREGEYLTLKNSIDQTYAQSLGFKEVKSGTIYVSVGSSLAGLSFNSGI